MQKKLIQFKTVKFWKDKNSLFMVNEHGQMHVVGVNFIKHVLEIPYTRKDGTAVTKEDILSGQNRKVAPKNMTFPKFTQKRVY